ASPASRAKPVPEGPLVYCILERFSRTELRDPRRLDIDFQARLRIATAALGAAGDVEGTETDQGHHAALFHRRLDRGDGRVERAAGGGLGDIGGLGDVIDDFQLVHWVPLDFGYWLSWISICTAPPSCSAVDSAKTSPRCRVRTRGGTCD